MRVLITGISGFAGKHLERYLLNAAPHIELHGTVFTAPAPQNGTSVQYHCLDLRNEDGVHDLIAHVQPEQIYHLAAQSFVPRSFEAPWETIEINTRSLLNLITGCLRLKITPRILVVSSAQIYGAVTPNELPINEDTPLRPSTPYSVSKVAEDLLALQYTLSHQLPILRARPFNHFGPGQDTRFVAADFALQIARIEAGHQTPVISVGNLSAERDYSDVRDVVRAYHLIMERGTVGDVYNVASGNAYSIQYLLDKLIESTSVPIEVRVDQARLRPVDVPCIRGDISRLTAATGWTPTISFEQTIRDVLEDCRQRVRQGQA